MRSYIKQGYFFFRYDNRQRDSIFVGYAHCLNAFELAAGMVVLQMGLKRVFFEIAQNAGKFCFQLRMAFFEPFR